MRCTVLAACFAVLALAAGCYSPKVDNGGFACSPTDNPPCPSGFFCVGGLCVDSPNANVPTPDMSTGTGGNGGGGGVGGGGGGGGGSDVDMAHAVDMAHPPAGDMATGGSCAMQNEDCTNTPCCSGLVCFPLFNICT